jgi:hypothetical protein
MMVPEAGRDGQRAGAGGAGSRQHGGSATVAGSRRVIVQAYASKGCKGTE